MAITPRRQFQRRRTAAQWASENPVLAAGEIGVITGSVAPGYKIGDGATAFNDLDIEIPGVIRTGTPFAFPAAPDLSKIRFGGIEGEARFVGAMGIDTVAGTMDRTNGLASRVLPNAATTDALVTIEIEEYWLDHSLNIGFEWRNLSAGSGNVRWHFEVREIDILTETVAAAPTPLNYDLTGTGPTAGMITTEIIAASALGEPTREFIPNLSTPSPAYFASVYALLIRRIGGDAADTLAGDVGLVAVSWGRSDT